MASGTNLNDVVVPGAYSIGNGTYTGGPNGVNMSWGLLMVFRSSAGGATDQVLLGVSSTENTIYFRRRAATAYGSWYKIVGTAV